MKVPGDDLLFEEDSYYQIFPNFDNFPFIEQNNELPFTHSLGWLVQPWFWLELHFPRDLEGERYPTPEETDLEEFDIEEVVHHPDDEMGDDEWSTDPGVKENLELLEYNQLQGDEQPHWDTDIFDFNETDEVHEDEDDDEEEPPFDLAASFSTHTSFSWSGRVFCLFARLFR